MKIVFLSGGARQATLRYLLEKKEEVIAVITPLLSSKNTRFEKVIATAAEFGVPIFPVSKENLDSVISKIPFDILISCGYPFIIDKKILSRAKIAINVHPTLLPKYRGYRSGPYIIINGETEDGVTVHLMTEEMDKGDIILQQSFPTSVFDTNRSLQRKCQTIEPELLFRAIQMVRNNTFSRTPQNESDATEYNYVRTPKDSIVDWNKPLKELYNVIRACDPVEYPAYFFVNGEKVCIKLWRPEKSDEEEDMI